MNLEIVLAIVIIVAALVQVSVLILIYRILNRVSSRVERVVNTIEPEINGIAESTRSVRHAVEVSMSEISSTLAGVRATSDELTVMARAEGEEFSRVARKAAAASERQIEEVNASIDRARGRIAEIGEGFDRSVLEPARVILAFATGVRKAVETLTTPRSREIEPPADPWADATDVGSS